MTAALALGLLLAGAAQAPAHVAAGAAADAVADTVLVARHDLARGVVLTAADVDTVVVPAAPRGARTAPPASVVGWRTRRVVRAGEPLRRPAVEPLPLIARGSTVTVVWETRGLRLTREGTAVGAADLGERVVVRVDGARRVTGVAAGAGTVTVLP